jgi:mannose-6-phosphate isomerase-like protein (cupin superfamily)
MPLLIKNPTLVPAVGTKPKEIYEFIGRLNTGDTTLSIARMISPEGWIEPGQTPEFTEYTLVLKGCLCVETRTGLVEVRSGQTIITQPGEWIRYSTPFPGGAEYIAICLPAFSPQTVHRDDEKSE